MALFIPQFVRLVKYNVAFDTNLLIGLDFINRNEGGIYPAGRKIRSKTRSHKLQLSVESNPEIQYVSVLAKEKPPDNIECRI